MIHICKIATKSPFVTKAELPLEGIFFALNFLPWEYLLVKKLEIEKTKTNFIISFKSCIQGGLSFFDLPTFLLIKIPREEN